MPESFPGLLEWLSNEQTVRTELGEPTQDIKAAIRSARKGDHSAGLRLLKKADPDLAALEGGNPMAKTTTIEGMTITGNPEGVPLHAAMAGMADWLDYEADVVAEAAEEIDDPEIAAAAEDQAEAMEEAAEALDDAADEARETAAEVFTETGTPSDEQEAEVVAGNADAPEGAAVEDTPAATPEAIEKAEVSSIETTAMGNPDTWRVDINDGEGNTRSVPFDSEQEAQDFATAFRQLPSPKNIVETVTVGNPGGTDVAPGAAAPLSGAATDQPPEPMPPEASPVPITASGHGGAAETKPDPSHWYNRPLIKKG